MVGRQTIRMDGGNGPLTVMDESPTSSPNSSPSPDMLSTESRRTEALSRSRVVPGSSLGGRGRPAAANAARERNRVQTLRHAFLELQRTLPSVPPDTKLSKLDVLILATTYIAHLTRTLQEEGVEEGESTRQTEALQSLKGDGYLHPVKVGVRERPRLYLDNSLHSGSLKKQTNKKHFICFINVTIDLEVQNRRRPNCTVHTDSSQILWLSSCLCIELFFVFYRNGPCDHACMWGPQASFLETTKLKIKAHLHRLPLKKINLHVILFQGSR